MGREHQARTRVLSAVPLSIAVFIHLAGCNSSHEPPAAMSMEDVEALEAQLAADPKRLKEMQRRCKYEREVVGEQVCTAVSGAARKRFMRSSKTPYTLQPTEIPNAPYANSP